MTKVFGSCTPVVKSGSFEPQKAKSCREPTENLPSQCYQAQAIEKKGNAREEFFQAERLWSPAQRSGGWRAKETQPVKTAKRLPLLRFPARRCAATSESPSRTEPGAKNGKILRPRGSHISRKLPPESALITLQSPSYRKKSNVREEFFQAERLWSPAQRSDGWRAKETQPANAAKRLPLLRFPARRCAATSESPSRTEPGAKNGKILRPADATFQESSPQNPPS
ncbi:hypothetical protein EDM59_16415 [Brevibacillus nitrificans]|uniref:Uncharacterized protein n=1 Tax=Brevibacillus nitrificans TaxID=651560 RepID=A0A3M8D8T9_9BACL|nr:hypothetical protein EDM59_16415 [Brevibacillus nitrificans]